MEYLKKITESERCLKNAREMLKKAGRKNGYYKDAKSAKIALKTACNSAQLAAEAYLIKRGIEIIKPKDKTKNADNYIELLEKQNRMVFNHFNTAYHILLLTGYYDGFLDSKYIGFGLEALEELIDAAKK